MKNEAHLVWVKDPMNYKESSVRYVGGVGMTPREWMAEIWGEDFDEFERPTVLHINNDEIMRDDWHTRIIEPGDVLVFVPVIGGTLIAILIIAVIIAVVLVLFLDIPVPNQADSQEGASVYSLAGQNNKTRLNEPIERHYGEVRHWPSYAARYYNQTQGNEQTLYALFCIGLGKYIIDEELISDTPVSSFSEVETAIYAPGERVTLFPTNVETSAEVQNVILYGPNQTGESGEENEGSYDGPVGPYVANQTLTETNKLEFDLNFPQGLYTTSDQGETRSQTVTVRLEYQQIDNDGNTVGAWTLGVEETYEMKTTTPQRFTIEVPVALGRYQVRAVRVNDANLSNRAQDTVQLASLRAFIDGEQNFGNVTLWAVKALATNNLNNSTRALFNVRVRAVIPVYNATTQTWSDQATRNPVWAMCDILRANYGMRLPDNFIDLEYLANLAAELDTDNVYFDWTFDRRGRVWDSCKLALNVGRTKPLMRGPLATAIRDNAETAPVAGFNHKNILKNSFKAESTFIGKFAHDGLLVEYRDPDTWTAETVLCLVDNDQGLNPRKIQLVGCTDRQRAYEWGLYTRASELWQKDNITLVTGPEGLSLSYGDLVAVKHDLLPTSLEYIDEQTGRLDPSAIVPGASSTTITLPKVPTITQTESDHFISIRKKDGSLAGPYLVTASNGAELTIGEVLNNVDFTVGEKAEAATYFFGANSNIYQLGKIISMRPRDNWETELKVINYEPRMYQFGGQVAPALDRPSAPVIPAELPTIENLNVATNPDNLNQAFVTWDSADGATDYVVSSSQDGGSTYVVEGRVQTPGFTLSVQPGTVHIKVYGINVGAGAAATWSGSVGVAVYPPPSVSNLRVLSPFEEDQLELGWDTVGTATSYGVTIKQGSTTLRTIEVTGNAYNYKAVTAKQDAQIAGVVLARALTVEVVSKNSQGDSGITSATFNNPGPVVLTSPTAAFVSASGNDRTYRFSASPGANFDLDFVEVHASLTDGFTAGAGNLVASYVANQNSSGYIDATIDTGATGTATIYFKIAAKDVWGEERTLTPQQSFTG